MFSLTQLAGKQLCFVSVLSGKAQPSSSDMVTKKYVNRHVSKHLYLIFPW